MMDKKLEERIRERAYQLWMRHGSIHGRADEYWYQAEREVRGESSDDEGTPAAPIIDPAPLGMTSMTEDEELSPPVAPKTRKKRTPAAAPATEGTEASVTPKRRRTTRVI
jgi:Protein of unknown function (DUF2934)